MIGTRRRFLRLATVIVMLGVPSRLLAQCAFDAPTKAKGIKTSMVRAYAGCVGGITFPSSNTSTMAGVPGCTPPMALSQFEFGSAGSCSIKVSQRIESPCPLETDSCAIWRVEVNCKDIYDPGGTTPTETGDWALSFLARLTWNATAAGDQTVIDFPLQVPLPGAHNGQLRVKMSVPTCSLLFGCEAFAWPDCTSVQLIRSSIVDPDGNIFAVMGSSSR
jgi:hypothetical protein